jgi:hypothetical protein
MQEENLKLRWRVLHLHKSANIPAWFVFNNVYFYNYISLPVFPFYVLRRFSTENSAKVTDDISWDSSSVDTKNNNVYYTFISHKTSYVLINNSLLASPKLHDIQVREWML